MKTVIVEISEARAAALEAALDAGEFETAAEAIDVALAALLDEEGQPDPDALERDIDEVEARERQGEGAMSAEDALRGILADLKE